MGAAISVPEHIYEAMSSYFKGHYQTGLLHGSLKDEEKNAVMQDFKDNKIQILVSTTVVEVGVDVPNANMMVIYNAERFGLSSIHQLRGRIGRGNQQGYCFLLSVAQDEPAKERLHYLEEHDDGFEISQYDLKTRGPGELLGDKQSGLPAFMMGDIFKDMNILEETRRYAIKMIHDYYKYGEYERNRHYTRQPKWSAIHTKKFHKIRTKAYIAKNMQKAWKSQR